MKSFLNYSKKIGTNFLLSQGPGGNTSTKIKNEIYIKKSGMYLENSINKDIFEKVDLAEIRKFYNKNKTNIKFLDSLSIESPIHVLLDEKHVFHYHSISSILVSAISDKNTLNKKLMKDAIIPINYVRPGYELASEIIKNTQNKKINSFFLYNHGMVVSGNNLENIYGRINNLELVFKKIINFKQLNNLINKTEIVFDPISNENYIKNPNPKLNFERFNGKYFFPDHAVFLPFNFIKKNKWNGKDKNCITFDDKYLYIKSDLDKASEIYLKVLITICSYIGSNKIYNFISKIDGENLRNSEDEVLRIEINK